MDLFPFTLVVLSTFTHAYWNFLIKRSSGNKDVFTALTKGAELTIFLPVFLYFVITRGLPEDFWFYSSIAAVLTGSYYLLLAHGYEKGDLSVIYPISRSSGLFLPAIAFFAIGEVIDLSGVAAIGLILLGTYLLHLPSFSFAGVRQFSQRVFQFGSLYALAAAMFSAGYTVWDKISIQQIPLFEYFYAYSALIAIAYLSLVFVQHPTEEIKNSIQHNTSAIVQVAVFNVGTYLLVLVALEISKASYVGALRQLSIVTGVLLGVWLLKEEISLPKVLGIMCIVLGGVAIKFAG